MLGQQVSDVDAEAIDAAVGPEAQRPQEIVANISVVPVEVRLLASVNVQIPLAVPDLRPHRAPEPGLPVRRRLRTIGPRAVAEDVTIARPASRAEPPAPHETRGAGQRCGW